MKSISEIKIELFNEMARNDLIISLYYLIFIVGSTMILNPFIGTWYFLSFIYMRWIRTYNVNVYNYYLLIGATLYTVIITGVLLKELKVPDGTKLPWY